MTETELKITEKKELPNVEESQFAVVQRSLLTNFPEPINTMSYYYSIEPIFAYFDCDDIVKLGNQLQLDYQKITPNTIDKTLFNTKVNYFLYDHSTEVNYFYEKIRQEVIKANNSLWLFNLYDFGEPLKFMEYSADYTGFVKTHADLSNIGVTRFRKLTIIVQLSDEEDYDGGDLVVQNYEVMHVMSKKRGTIIIFPSFLLHRVDPVTRGIRNSLVTFAYGPPFC